MTKPWMDSCTER